MKKLALSFMTVMACLNAAADNSVSGTVINDDVSARISINGRGKFVCAVKTRMGTKLAYLARGSSETSAMALAKNACLADGGGIFCEPYTCEKDRSKRNSDLDVVFDIRKSASSVSILFSSGDSQKECVGANSLSKVSYIASAATQLEASVLLHNQCQLDGGGIFCDDLDEIVCSGTSGFEVKIGEKKGLRGLLESLTEK